MKKCLCYLFAWLCIAGFFSCSDDKEEPGEPWQEIAGSYTGEKLKLQLNGAEVAASTIGVETVSADKGTVDLGNLIAGAANMKVDVTLKATGAETIAGAFAMEGRTKVDSRTVSVDGVVGSGVLSLNVNVKVESAIVGRWGLAPYIPADMNGDGKIDENDYNVMAGCFFLQLETATGFVTLKGETIPDRQFCMFADKKAEDFLNASLQDISFLENGNVVFTYLKDGQAVPLAGMAGYYVKDQMLYMTLDLMHIMELLTTKEAGPDPLLELIALAQNGIPLAYLPGENGASCTLLVNKAMATALISKLTPLLKLLPYLPGIKDNPEILAMLGEIGNLMGTIATGKEFNAGINLVKK